jgi:preflagellin peptidase FlaK
MALEGLDVVRLFTGAMLLAFASWTDWRWRRAPNLLWWIASGVGLALLAAQLVENPSLVATAWPLLLVSGVFAAMIYGFYWVGLLPGGADAKALMGLALLAPLPIQLGAFPLIVSPLPPAFGILGNTLLAFLVVPLGLFAYNASRGRIRFPHSFLGVTASLEEARGGRVWPMEYVKDGEVRTMLMSSRFEWEEEDFEALAAAGRTEIWVTPKVPFMIPLLAGFVSALLLGDVLGGMLLQGIA